ncbi:MAG: hypothetical protein H6744_14520 [Deltaproteobacteria bacterium]|nr:hypothetical protein [Deltaproteobacteria bacterium]MCB9787895.1 hypothetical protein [Deltaproteobacteria bacterium]
MAARPWAHGVVFALAVLDVFIMVIPIDEVMMLAVLARPKRWVRAFLLMTLGSAVGALLVSLLVQLDLDWVHRYIIEPVMTPELRDQATRWLSDWGILALAGWALSFLPLPPAVIVVALAGVSPLAILAATFLGRVPKSAFFAWLTAKAPQKLARWGLLSREFVRSPDEDEDGDDEGDGNDEAQAPTDPGSP